MHIVPSAPLVGVMQLRRGDNDHLSMLFLQRNGVDYGLESSRLR
jgi:hypothetical protein